MKKRLIISSVISIFLVSMLLLGSTYSIFTSQEIDETANVYKTGNLNVIYSIKNVDNKNSVQITDPTPMTIEEADAVFPYRVTVTNSGNVPYEFDVILLDTTSSTDNTIDYQYIMTKVGYLDPIALSNCTNNIIKENVIVPAGEKVDIDVRIWLDTTLPNTEIGKSFYAKLKIDGLAVYNDDEDIDNSDLSLRYMKTTNGTNYFNSDTYRNYITTASFVDYIDTTNAAINTETNEKIMWDMSTSQDKSVIAWLEDNGEVDESGSKLYNLYIGSRDKIYARTLSFFFLHMQNLTTIITTNISVAQTTGINAFCFGCLNLVEIDVSKFNTSNINSMGYAFRECKSLEYLDVSNWDVSGVNRGDNNGGFRELFHYCESLKEIDVSNWDVSNAGNLVAVFADCSSLTSLDVSSWELNNAESIVSLFMNCTNLIDLNLFVINSSIPITSLNSVFSGCSSLVELDLSEWNTSNITNMGSLFGSCNNLSNLDISNWDTSNVTAMGSMFIKCYNLNVDLSNWDTSNVTDMRWMFHSCINLETSFTISNVNVNTTGMFGGIDSLATTSITLNYVCDDLSTEDINESTESIVISLVNGTTVLKGECIGDYCSV